MNTQAITVDSNPTQVVSAPVGTLFIRDHNDFYMRSPTGVVTKLVEKYKPKAYNTAAYKYSLVIYKTPYEIWEKTGGGTGNTGWSFVAYRKYFFDNVQVEAPAPDNDRIYFYTQDSGFFTFWSVVDLGEGNYSRSFISDVQIDNNVDSSSYIVDITNIISQSKVNSFEPYVIGVSGQSGGGSGGTYEVAYDLHAGSDVNVVCTSGSVGPLPVLSGYNGWDGTDTPVALTINTYVNFTVGAISASLTPGPAPE